MGEGLKRILQRHGSMKIGGKLWLWDYANQCHVDADEMPEGGERWKASEKAKCAHFVTALTKEGE